MVIQTPRLMLREFQPEDVQQLAPILAHPQVMQFSSTGVLSVSETAAKIQSFIQSYQHYGFGKWAVIHQASNELIGYCGIAIEQLDHRDEREIGYRLNPAFWGQGLATEAASAALQYGFEQFKFPYVLGIVELGNHASVNVLKKLGMHYQRRTQFHGGEVDVYCIENAK